MLCKKCNKQVEGRRVYCPACAETIATQVRERNRRDSAVHRPNGAPAPMSDEEKLKLLLLTQGDGIPRHRDKPSEAMPPERDMFTVLAELRIACRTGLVRLPGPVA